VIFIDTGAFVARYLVRDQNHAEARKVWEKIRESRDRCLTSSFVIDETLTLLARRAGAAFASERGRAIYSSGMLTILRPSEEDELRAVGLLKKYGDQRVSFTDCVSFVLMRRERIRRAFTFDGHFSRPGFTVVPG
jgi:predicted nucleic acid-binding protein